MNKWDNDRVRVHICCNIAAAVISELVKENVGAIIAFTSGDHCQALVRAAMMRLLDAAAVARAAYATCSKHVSQV